MKLWENIRDSFCCSWIIMQCSFEKSESKNTTMLTSRQHVLKWPQQLPYALISFESQQSGPLGPSSTPLWVQAIPFRLCPWRGHTNSNAPLSICCKWNVCPVTDNPLQSFSYPALQPSPSKNTLLWLIYSPSILTSQITLYYIAPDLSKCIAV